MLRYSSSVNTKIYALHLKQKSNAGVFHGILRNFRTATFQNDFERLLLKRKQGRRRSRSDRSSFRFSLFPEQLFISHEIIFFLSKFSHSETFQLDYVLHFYKPKRWLLLSKFQWQKYLVVIRKKIKVLHDNLPRVNECATMPSVNNVSTYKVNLDKLIKLRNF